MRRRRAGEPGGAGHSSRRRRQPKRYFVGLDLGQAADPTALAILERSWVKPGAAPGLRRPPHSLRHLHRFPPGTHYSAIIETLRDLLNTQPLPGATTVVLDQTGVGQGEAEEEGYAALVNAPARKPGGITLIRSEGRLLSAPPRWLTSWPWPTIWQGPPGSSRPRPTAMSASSGREPERLY